MEQRPCGHSTALASRQEGARPRAHIWVCGIQRPSPSCPTSGPEFCVFFGSAGRAALCKGGDPWEGLVLSSLALQTPRVGASCTFPGECVMGVLSGPPELDSVLSVDFSSGDWRHH